ncbi:MAG: YlxR family protein [Armatimonadetes bacterium]|nr:YlxR family protein [Armatimonadota bacterium]
MCSPLDAREDRLRPLRTCVGCGRRRGKRELARLVLTEGRGVLLDRKGKSPGRGVYLCFEAQCLETADKRRAVERSLRISLTPDQRQLLKQEVMEFIIRMNEGDPMH